MTDYHTHSGTSCVCMIDVESDRRWDEFVLSNPYTSIYVHSAWVNVVAKSFNYKPLFLAFVDTRTGQLENVMPFLLVESWITGTRLVSLPFTAYCANNISSEQISQSISFALQSYPKIKFLEWRVIEDFDYSAESSEKHHDYCTHILDLDISLDHLYESFHSTSIRQRIKRAKRNDLRFRIAEDEGDLKKFYVLETEVRRKHGIPPHPYRFFANMWKILRPLGYFFLALVEYQDKTVAAATVLRFKDSFYLEYSASDQKFLKLSPNQILIWEVIKIAHRANARYFDFGRSALSNQLLIEFKERWGAKAYQLTYHYFPKSKRNISKESSATKLFHALNRILPKAILIKEGELLLPHLG